MSFSTSSATGRACLAMLALTASLSTACNKSSLPFFGSSGGSDGSPDADKSTCPATSKAPVAMPNVKAEQRTAAYWLARHSVPEQTIMSAAAIVDHQRGWRDDAGRDPAVDPRIHDDLLVAEDPARLRRDVTARLTYMSEQVDKGIYVDGEGKPLSSAAKARFRVADIEAKLAALGSKSLRRVTANTPLRCGPQKAGLFKGPKPNLRFDRNNCSTLRVGEVVNVLGDWGDMQLVRSAYALGWLAADAPLSKPIAAEEAKATLLPKAKDLTRRAFFERAFSFLDKPYGWGGQDGGRDCSRFLMDSFAPFGLQLPRHSRAQSTSGAFTVDVTKAKSEPEKMAVIDAAAKRGVVLLHFPGHIMLYLGRSKEGRPMALHAFAEYAKPCAEPDGDKKETLVTVDKVHVTDLELGRGSSRRSFVERITTVTVFAEQPGEALLGAVSSRRPAGQPRHSPGKCEAVVGIDVFTTPRRPHVGAPLRVVVGSDRDFGSAQIFMVPIADSAAVLPVVTQRLGGPPFGLFGEVKEPTEGKYQVVVADGDSTKACGLVTVSKRGDGRQAGSGAVWGIRKRWDRRHENLYSLFVEQLFRYPLDDRTWPSLQELLRDQEHNLLYNHLGQSEETRMTLSPDCADLPYFLRAYFAWKLRLPFGYRHCNRGSKGKAPYCDRDLHTNLVERESSGEVPAFAHFARKTIADGVHSGSGRTGPSDDHTDYYPVPLNRASLRPGTMFADPYGHLFVIAGWQPQTVGSYGALIGADAQPDHTVGRRRFWRGSFLFTPDTTEAGAGFKAFRPLRYRGGRLVPIKNKDIAATGLTPHSQEQYEGDVDAFYDRVEGLINPRPLDPLQSFDLLITALHEQVTRRVISVVNGEEYKAKHRGAVKMPSGHSVFETTGAWENYSTPSRDMRLLIAMDTVLGFIGSVKRQPQRYGIDKGKLAAAVAKLEAHRDKVLKAKTITYEKSDGQKVTLSLQDVVDRAKNKGFEMAYNPNDCVEIRWAAPVDGDEMKTCKRHAPTNQQRKMVKYRHWFAERKRPAR